MARRHTRFVRPAPRTKMWIGAGVGATTLVGSSVQLIGSLIAGALLLRPFTILRTRMDIMVRSDQAATSESVELSYGHIVITEAAEAIGVTAIPDPSGITGDPEADWFVWQALANTFTFLSSVGFDGDNGYHVTIDSKAMRKVGPDDQMVQITSLDTSAGATFVNNGCMLVQLH